MPTTEARKLTVGDLRRWLDDNKVPDSAWLVYDDGRMENPVRDFNYWEESKDESYFKLQRLWG